MHDLETRHKVRKPSLLLYMAILSSHEGSLWHVGEPFVCLYFSVAVAHTDSLSSLQVVALPAAPPPAEMHRPIAVSFWSAEKASGGAPPPRPGGLDNDYLRSK